MLLLLQGGPNPIAEPCGLLEILGLDGPPKLFPQPDQIGVAARSRRL
jgi:hypothetical protein